MNKFLPKNPLLFAEVWSPVMLLPITSRLTDRWPITSWLRRPIRSIPRDLNTIYRRFTIHFQSSVVLLNWDRKLTVLKVWLLFIVFSIVCRTSFGELRRGRNPLAPSHPLDPELQKKAWPKATYRNVVAVRSVPVSSIRSLSAVCHFGLGFGFLSDSIAHCPCFVKWRHITVCQECIWMASSIWIQPAHPVTIGMAFQLDVMAVKS